MCLDIFWTNMSSQTEIYGFVPAALFSQPCLCTLLQNFFFCLCYSLTKLLIQQISLNTEVHSIFTYWVEDSHITSDNIYCRHRVIAKTRQEHLNKFQQLPIDEINDAILNIYNCGVKWPATTAINWHVYLLIECILNAVRK